VLVVGFLPGRTLPFERYTLWQKVMRRARIEWKRDEAIEYRDR